MTSDVNKVNILCLKWGKRYPAFYVNRLYAAVKRNMSRPFRFVCITDDSTGIDPAVDCDNPGWSIYQCKRRSSLFKKVAYDRKTGEVDEITFRDIDRAVCVDINKPDCMYTGGMGPLLLDEMMPITLPYSPCGKTRIFTEDFKYHEEYEGDMDTVGVLYFRMPDGTMKEVKRYFKEDHESKQMVEISQSEYLSRKKRVEDRMRKTSPEVK